jgi:hypothetical protein
MAVAMSEASSAIHHAATIEPHRHREPSARASGPDNRLQRSTQKSSCGKRRLDCFVIEVDRQIISYAMHEP